ncbi:MAG: bacteriophage abortive infection AbiH family protein [Planctomycetaceae bacterium]|nr:bacteriophage abortive infection AbiH family protein [Planctomycetaceae bacterium]
MTIFYIIGNGFDLWHGLPTSYGQFYEYAKDTLDDAERYFDPGDTDRPWSDFESSLGTYDWRELFDECNFTDPTSESFKVSETYGLQDELTERADELHRSIEECFCEWVDQIDVNAASKQMKFDAQARFISFNYTSTLQTVYEIDESRILHIHGRSNRGEVIFGHGVEVIEEPELDENGDSNRSMFTDSENAAKYPLHAFQKQTGAIIQNQRAYFDSLCGLTRIAVLGHSLADVDLPYFKEVANRNTDCEWIVYYYNESQKPSMVQQLVKCGVDATMISARPYPNDATKVPITKP